MEVKIIMNNKEKLIKEMAYDIGPVSFIEHNGARKSVIF